MSSSISPITTYLSIVKNEQTQVAQMVKTDPTIKRTVAAFQADTVHIASSTDLLASKNQAALQVVLGAYNMSGESSATGLLKKLLTQDPSVSGSLVRSLNDTDDLHFVKAMTPRTTVALAFGDPASANFTATGALASSVWVQNLSWGTANASLTAATPAKSWTYVLNDGTAAQSIATALTSALQSTATSTNPVTDSYSVNAAGAIVGTANAPAISTSTDSAGNTIYSLTLATSSSGAIIRSASVISVTAPVPVLTTPPTTTINTATATPLLARALTATGFNVQTSGVQTSGVQTSGVQTSGVQTSGQSGLNILNPIDNSALSLSSQCYLFTDFVAFTQKPISTYQNVLPLGASASSVSAGQILSSGGQTIGTVKSVDAAGDVTLIGPSALNLDPGAQINVEVGAGLTNIATQITATQNSTTDNTVLALGLTASKLQAGQTITDGSTIIGTVQSVDASGNVTLRTNAAANIAAGDTLSIAPQATDTQTAALLDQSNVSTILSNYETSQYEAQQDQQTPGMGDALYFTRTMPTITSITQLMSDTRLLNVVTTDLGLSDTYNQLPYDQQLSLLTSKIKLSDYANPAKLQNAAEQFLALTSENAASGGVSTDPASILLSGGDGSNGGNPGDALMAALYPGSSSNSSGLDGILGALYA